MGSLLVVPFGRRRVLGVVTGLAETTEIEPDRLAAPLEALELGVPPSWCGWPRGWPPSTARRPPAPRARAPPGRGRGVRERTVLVTDADGGRGGGARGRGEARLAPARGARAARGRAARRPRRSWMPATARCDGWSRAGWWRWYAARAGGARITRGSAPRPPERRRSRPPRRDGARAGGRGVGRGAPRFLLQGVTGSGKTEVYLRAAGRGAGARPRRHRARARDRADPADRRALRGALRRRPWPCCTRALGDGERHDEWLRLRRGEARVCVGPRSAVFAPRRRPRPRGRRRGARRLLQARGRPALRRARGGRAPRREAGAVLLCGSATPRPESVRALARLRSRRASTAVRCRRSRCWTCATSRARCTRARARRSRRCGAAATRRSCCSTAGGGRTSCRAGRAGGCGSARTATSRWSCTAPSGASRLPPLRPPRARAAALRRLRLVVGRPARGGHGAPGARAVRGARRRPTSRCSASTPTRPRRAARSPRARAASRRPRPACSWERRWWPRGTTSPTSRSAWCSTPTPRCASPTSAPRSGRSRWWRSWRGARDAGARGGRVLVQTLAPEAPLDRPRRPP